jgi:PD-(D/E)XK nuclease superfamily
MPPACTTNSSTPDFSWSHKSRSPSFITTLSWSAVIEIKSVDCLNDIHLAQVLTYLKLANCRLGLLMNFNVLRLKEGIRRVVNNL